MDKKSSGNQAIKKNRAFNTAKKRNNVTSSSQDDLIKLTKANEQLRHYNTQLFIASKEGNLSKVKAAMEKGADSHLHEGSQVHFYNDDENNPLHLSARYGHLGIVKYLVEKGANINAKNRRQATPLHMAVYEQHLSVIKFLIKKGANIEANDIDGGTPLSWAAYVGKLSALKVLTTHGANIHSADHNQITPLHWACYKDNIEMVKFLIEQGADVDIERLNIHDDTPLTSAIVNGCTDIVLYLVDIIKTNAVRNARKQKKV